MKIKKFIYLITLSMLLILSSCVNDTECKHTSTKWVVDKVANCLTEGHRQEECTKCHKVFNEETLSKTTHNYINGICKVCNKKVSTGFEYKLNLDNSSYSIVGIGSCNDTNIIIPDAYQMLPVTSIGKDAFNKCRNITNITIPSTITNIDGTIFDECTSLKSIIVEDDNPSYKSIDGNLYSKDETTLIKYAIGKETNNFIVPTSVTNIFDKAFDYSINLVDIEINKNIKSIGKEAFKNCYKLENVYYSGSFEDWCYITFNDYYSNPMIYATKFYIYDDSDESNELTELVIPDTVTDINYQLSGFKNITTITLPCSVLKIEEDTFYEYENLQTVYYEGTIEDWCNIKFMGGYFGYSSPMEYASKIYMLDKSNNYQEVTEIVIPSSITEIGDHQFEGFRNVTKITLPSTLTSIGIQAFNNCHNIITMEIPNSVTSINDGAFSNCANLEYIYLPNKVETLPPALFEGCANLKSIEIPTNITSIENSMFLGCRSLTSIVLPSNVTTIKDYAFYNCSSLTSIEIPNSVTSIGDNVFYECINLTYNVYDNGKYLGNSDNPYLALISSISVEISSIEINPNTKVLGSGAFRNCTNLTTIDLPDCITNINSNLFYNCSSLTNIVIPDTVTDIHFEAFYNCTSLTSITMPGSIISIEKRAFSNCKNLEDVYYNGLVEDWCNITFSDSYSNPMFYASHFYLKHESGEYLEVTEIEIPNTVTKIGDYQFYGFNNLTQITLSSNLNSIGYEAFINCNNLHYNEYENGYYLGNNVNPYLALIKVMNFKNSTFKIHKDTKIICPTSFYNYTNLLSVELSNNIISIGSWAFYNCKSLEKIIIPSNVIYIENLAFYYCSKLTIYCEEKTQPSTWSNRWNQSNCPVIWDYNNN